MIASTSELLSGHSTRFIQAVGIYASLTENLLNAIATFTFGHFPNRISLNSKELISSHTFVSYI